ncbi:hypothetical protein D3C77_559110 [compost metagenome]
MKGILNDRPVCINAPGILCLAEGDKWQITEKHKLAAQSFNFDPGFLISAIHVETQDYSPTAPSIQTGRSLFQREHPYMAVPRITEKAYPLLSLNKLFQERCGYTAIGYLPSHRFKIACDLLTHRHES